jgi:hypothetical protein
MELERVILTTPYISGAEKTNSWRVRKEDLQCAFPLDVLMVHSPMLAISTDVECLTWRGFSLGEIVRFRSVEFITNCFGGMSLSPGRNDSGAAFIGSTHSVPPSSLWAMIEDSTKEFHMASSGEGGSSLPSPRRHVMGLRLLPSQPLYG